MRKPIAFFVAFSAVLALGSMTPGCGGDDDTTGTGGSGGSGGSGTTGGKGGTGGTGGSTGGTGGGTDAGKGGTAGTTDAGPDGPATVVCGTKTCVEDTSTGTVFLPCCAMGETNTCGYLFAVACLTTTPGTTDPACAEVTIPGAGAVPGCCRSNGLCGAAPGAPFGCVDISILGQNIPCGPDAAPPPPRDSGTDTSQPPTDSGGTDGSSTDGTSTDGTSIDGTGGDTGGGDATPGDAPAEGGGSDGASDTNGDRAG